jgi:hypothetical protein
MAKAGILKNIPLKENVYNKEAVDIKLNSKLNEAPVNGKAHCRQNGAWSELHIPAVVSTAYVGEIFWYPKKSPPPYCLYCDGSAIDREDYAELFAVIGTDFGEGDGSTTFNLPDMRGEFVRGYDPGNARDPSGSTRAFGKHQEATLIPQGGSWRGESIGVTRVYMPQPSSNNSGFAPLNYDGAYGEVVNSVFSTTYSTNSGSARQAYAKVRPANISLLPCIRYGRIGKTDIKSFWENVPLVRAANNSGGTFELKYNALLGLYEAFLENVTIKAGTPHAVVLASLQNPENWPTLPRHSRVTTSDGKGIVLINGNICVDGQINSNLVLNIRMLAAI